MPDAEHDDFLNDEERGYFAGLPRTPSWARSHARGGELEVACTYADDHAVTHNPDTKLNSWIRTLEDIRDVNRKGRHAELSRTGE